MDTALASGKRNICFPQPGLPGSGRLAPTTQHPAPSPYLPLAGPGRYHITRPRAVRRLTK
jgi:hypothetical protein